METATRTIIKKTHAAHTKDIELQRGFYTADKFHPFGRLNNAF